MIDHNRRARPLIVAAAALAVAVVASGAVAAQSPAPVTSGAPATATPATAAPATPTPAPASVRPSSAPASSPVVSGAPATATPAPSIPVALLLPDTTELRWEDVDKVAFAAKLTEVCPTAVLDERNAGGDGATQAQQAQDALTAGARVLVVAPVDAGSAGAIVTSAHAAGAKVISYDTMIAGASPDYHIGYDPAAVGTLVVDAVLTSNSEANAAASPAPSIPVGGMRVVLINGPASDPTSAAWTDKVKAGLSTEATVVQEATVTAATADEGQRLITEAIAAVGADGFDAVISSNDPVAAGIVAGLTAANISPATRQVTGGDATVAGVQRILVDQQLFTTFAPPTAEAQLAAVVACGLATGTGLPQSLTPTPVNNGTADIPSLMLAGIVVGLDGSIAGTRSVASTIIADRAFGPDTTALICSGDYVTACSDAGIDLASPSPSASPAASVTPSGAPTAAPSAAPSVAPAASSSAAP